MRHHPMEIDQDEAAESWAALLLLACIALAACIGCMIWDGAIDGWRSIKRRARR
jgi:hypothetical protein